jgi:thioredoxin reductase (NADPH)
MTASNPIQNFQTIIVGGGIAGSAAALRAAQYQHRTLWIRGTKLDAKRSRAQWVYNIDNMIGVHDGIVRKKVRRLLRGDEHAAARALLDQTGTLPISTRDIVDNVVERIENEYASVVTMLEATAEHASPLDEKGEISFQVAADGQIFAAPHLVLATGVMDRQPSILKDRRGEIKDDIKWIYPAANREQVLYCIRCEGHLTRGKQVAVIGHSEAAAQISMMLHERYQSASVILTNGTPPVWSAESAQLLEHYGVSVIQARITDFLAEREGLHGIELQDHEPVSVGYALVAEGIYRVYNQLAIELQAELGDPGRPTEQRHVLIDSRGQTSVHNLFVIGDMAQRTDEPVMKQVYTSQEYAVRAIDSIDSRIRHERRRAALVDLNKT